MTDELSRQMSQPDRLGFPPVLQEKYRTALRGAEISAANVLVNWQDERPQRELIHQLEALICFMPDIEQMYALLKAQEAANG